MAVLARRAALVVLLASLAGCASSGVVADHLYFGTQIPSGGVVSPAEWDVFVKDVVTPRFPEGLSILENNGQWTDPQGVLFREHGYIIEVEHKRDAKSDNAIREIAEEYKRRFKQEAVLRITFPVTMKFY